MASSEAIRLVALQNVWNRRRKKRVDPDFQLREVFRWYSEHCHTPMHVVETLPLDDVFTHYWEAYYLSLDEKALEDERLETLQDPDELVALQRQEDEADLETHLLAQDERRKRAQEAKSQAINKLEDAAAALSGAFQRPIARKDRDPELVMGPVSKLTETPPDIEITFADDLDLDADTMGGDFGLLADPQSKKR